MVDVVDCVVIGAGVVGLAVARELALAGREVLVLEAQDAIGTGTSSRNSEVIHAGIYYAQGSRKARWCVEGKALLYAYCQERGIDHQRCGKLITLNRAFIEGHVHAGQRRTVQAELRDNRLIVHVEGVELCL